MASQFNENVQENVKSITGAIKELKEDITGFLQTRLQLLTAEMQQKLAAIKAAAPLFAVAIVMALLGVMVLTGALVYIIALGIGIGWSLLIVGVLYMAIAGGCAWIGSAAISKHGLAPKRTLQVLKQDQVWFQQETRSA